MALLELLTRTAPAGVVAAEVLVLANDLPLVGTYSAPGLFKTTDGGRSWSAIAPPGKGYVLALALDPTDADTIYAGMFDGAKAFKSTDGGRTWRALTIPVP